MGLPSLKTLPRTYDKPWIDISLTSANSYQLAVSNWPVLNEACSNLEVGQSLCLGLSGQDCKTTYEVQDGDYCDLIASKNSINSTMLMANNPQISDNCWNLCTYSTSSHDHVPLTNPIQMSVKFSASPTSLSSLPLPRASSCPARPSNPALP
jgi:hypothetical protein